MSTDHDEEKSTLPAPRTAQGQAIGVETGAEAPSAEGGARAELTGEPAQWMDEATQYCSRRQEFASQIPLYRHACRPAAAVDMPDELALPLDSGPFADWLAREMPPGTIIGNPAWWAPRILRQIARLTAKQRQTDHPDTARLDWLERHPRLAEFVVDGRATDCYLYAVSGAPGLKLREIIDAAMRAEPSKPVSAEVGRG